MPRDFSNSLFCYAERVSNSPFCYPERVLALALLVLRVLANHPHHTAAMDDLALVTNLFD
jgi:hypothetical protein